MTNDTTTLNGSLRELGELMANNLTEQGVASTYDEGLTTLANKILDIQGIPSTLTLTSDKSILSYHDRDTCTLTATLTGNDVANKTVEFFNGSTSLGTATTNSTGVATKTYTSQGIGDIEIFARVGTLVSKTCSVQDILLYLPTETYKSGNKVHFKIHNTFNLDNSTDWELSVDLKSQTSFIILSPVSNAESISTNDVSVYTGIGSNGTGSKLCALGYAPIINDGTIWDTTHGAYGSGYHSVKITKIGNKYTYYYDGSEITNTTSNDFTNQTPLYPYLRLGTSNANIYIKNVKVKQL